MSAGGSYEIPISFSRAENTSLPQNIAAGTVFNFSSPGASGDWYDQGQEVRQDATATSSAATGAPATNVTTKNAGAGDIGGGMDQKTILIIAGVAGIVILGGAFLYFQSK